MRRAISTVLVSALMLTGCFSIPQNAQEFRDYIGDGGLVTAVDKFEVERPFTEVKQTLEKMAPHCLNVTTEKTVTGRGYGNMPTSYLLITTYKPTVVVNEGKVELHVQHIQKGGGSIRLDRPPEGGHYLMVADARPVGENRTAVEMYRGKFGSKTLIKATKGWMTGEVKGCPDLSK